MICILEQVEKSCASACKNGQEHHYPDGQRLEDKLDVAPDGELPTRPIELVKLHEHGACQHGAPIHEEPQGPHQVLELLLAFVVSIGSTFASECNICGSKSYLKEGEHKGSTDVQECARWKMFQPHISCQDRDCRAN